MKNSKLKTQNSKLWGSGFVLIELLVVIAVIGVLVSTFSLLNYIGVRQRANDSQRKSNLQQIQTALELYRYDLGTYPVSLPDCSGSLTFGSAIYMADIPCDPKGNAYYNGGNYRYIGSGDRTGYTLCACLENANDSQGVANSTCGTEVVSAPSPRLGFFSRIANLISYPASISKLPKDPKQAGLPVFLVFKDFLVNVFTKTVIPAIVYADTAGPRSPALGESITSAHCSVAPCSWSSPNNILLSDNNRTSVFLPTSGNNISYYLRATGFGFSIPPGSTINGIVVEIEKSASLATQVRDYSVYIVKGGVAQGTNKRNSGYWPTTDTYFSYGSGLTDLWGVTWTPNDINASDFGVQVQAALYETADTTAYVDHIRITVYYTLAPPTLTPVPTATLTPVPTATLTPVPTATLTPVPTATLTPVPTPVPLPGCSSGKFFFLESQ